MNMKQNRAKNNSGARGETELACLNFVKNNKSFVCFFGMSDEEQKYVNNAIYIAQANSHASEFPDFLFTDGFIEHFQVTSSAEGRKGSKMEREKAELGHEIEEKIKNAKDNQIYFDASKNHSEHSYKNFDKSFKTAFESHLQSLSKYCRDFDSGIFMVQYSDCALRVYDSDIMESDFSQEKVQLYRLSKDEKLLRYVYSHRDKVKYIIFVTQERIDVIKVESALKMWESLDDRYYFNCDKTMSYEISIGMLL